MSTTWTPQEFFEGFTEEKQITLRTAFRSLQEGLERAKPYDTLRVLHAAPSKVFAGMLVNADGTDWNPGSGAGMYLRNEGNTAWNPVGEAISTGSFTPTISFVTPGDLAVTYSTQRGRYSRIGDQVTAYFEIVTSAFTHTTAAGNAVIGGMPASFPATTYDVGPCYWTGITKANYTQVSVLGQASTTELRLVASGSGQALTYIAFGDMPTGGTVQLAGSLTYTAA